MMSEARHLHPAAILILGVRVVRQFIIPFVILIVTRFGDLGLTGWVIWVAGAAGILLCLAGVWGFLAWRRFTYRVEEGELRIESGVFIRSRRFIPQERIHSIDLVESVWHRLFGVVNVRVETAGGGDQEGLLAAVSHDNAEALRQALTEKQQLVQEEDTPLFERRITRRELLIAGVTSGSIGIAFSLAGGVVSFIDNIIPNLNLFAVVDRFIGGGTTTLLLVLALIALIIAWVVAVIGTTITYGNFYIRRIGDDLLIERGLIERRRSTIPLSRIQAIRVVEGVLRQPFGFAALHVESAGYGLENAESTVLFPLVAKKEISPFLSEAVPEFKHERKIWQSLPLRAKRRSVVRAVLPIALLAGVVTIVGYPWGLLSLILLLPAIMYGLLRYRDAGWCVNGKKLILRSRGLGRTTAIVTRKRIQASGIRQSLFQRRKALGTFWVNVASGAIFNMGDIDEREGNRLLQWMSTKRK